MGDGDIKTLETVIHNQSRRYPPREEVYADRNVTINRIEQLPIEEIDQELGGNGRYTEESLNRSLESLLDEAPAEEDRVVVLANVEINGQQSKVPVRVVRQNGKWAVIR